MADVDANKIAELYKKQREYENARNNYNNTIENLNNKIDRLQPVKDKVSELKERFKNEVLDPDKKVLDDAKTWKGSTCNHFKDAKRAPIKEENESYYQNLDYILDSMEDELTRLKNEASDKNGLLGKVESWLRTIGNEITKAFN